MKAPLLQSFRLRNFKAVRDSLTIRFSPLTVLIGHNGSGKSSVIEGLEMFQAIVERGLDEAAQEWRGFEHIWHQGVQHEPRDRGNAFAFYSNPMSFDLKIKGRIDTIQAKMEISLGINAKSQETELIIQHEQVTRVSSFTERSGSKAKHREVEIRQADRLITTRHEFPGKTKPYESNITIARPGYSIIHPQEFVMDWQFVSLVPQVMGAPIPQKRTGGPIRLAKYGSNIAEYLLSIRNIDPGVFDGILETLKYVLPYARDLQPTLTSELERTVYLQLTEKEFKVPGWLLSTGTLRVLVLLALLRHPNPPSLIVIEEIENGLDPRTIHLMVDEIRQAVEAGRTQVIATTHSPYLLDLLTLSHLVLVERMEGQPVFIRPADQESLQNWIDRFGPGQLYTMGKLNSGQRP